MKPIAIITGASSGIGRQFVLQAGEQGRYGEIWAIARSHDALKETASLCKTPVRVLPIDLAKQDGIKAVADLLTKERPSIGLLVNAAGLGKFGPVNGQTPDEISQMIELNIHALTLLTRIVLPFMAEGGQVLQIASTASFQPLPDMAVYAASKAYVLSFSRALAKETKRFGVSVTAVCPGWTSTHFFDVAKQTANPAAVRNFPFMTRPADVVRKALRDGGRRKAVSVYGVHNHIHRCLAKLLPAGVLESAWMKLKN